MIRALAGQKRAGCAVACLVALLAAGCGGTRSSSSEAKSSGVTVTRAHGALGVAGGGPVAPSRLGWSALLNGASHFGAAPSRGPSTARIRWQRRLEGPIVPGPVTSGGVAYVASNAGVLHALDVASGRDRWTYDGAGSYGSDLSTAPAVLADGVVLWPGPRNRLYALDPHGHLLWTLQSSSEPLSPAVDQARGLLVLADLSGRLSAYRLSMNDGPPVRLWSRVLADGSFGNPALGDDGTTYQTAGNSLFAVSPDGQVRWQVQTSQKVEVSAALAQDGTVVFGSNDSVEYGVRPNGTVRWRHSIGNYTYSSPLTLAGDRVAFGNHSGEMSFLDARDGHLISRDRGRGQIWTAAAVDARGDAYFASRAGDIYGFDSRGRPLFTIHAGTTFDSYPALAADGTLLVGGDDGVLRAIR